MSLIDRSFEIDAASFVVNALCFELAGFLHILNQYQYPLVLNDRHSKASYSDRRLCY